MCVGRQPVDQLVWYLFRAHRLGLAFGEVRRVSCLSHGSAASLKEVEPVPTERPSQGSRVPWAPLQEALWDSGAALSQFNSRVTVRSVRGVYFEGS